MLAQALLMAITAPDLTSNNYKLQTKSQWQNTAHVLLRRADTNKPFQKEMRRANGVEKETLPPRIMFKVPRELMKHPANGKGGWQPSCQHCATAAEPSRMLPKGREAAGRHLLSEHPQCLSGWAQNS